MPAELNEALEDLNRSAVHLHDEMALRIARAKLVKGDKALKETLDSIKSIKATIDKAYDEVLDFAPAEDQAAAGKPAKKSDKE